MSESSYATLKSMSNLSTTGVGLRVVQHQNNSGPRLGQVAGGVGTIGGLLDDISTAEEMTISSGLLADELLTFDTTRVGVALEIASESAADDLTTGNGAQIVLVEWVDASLGLHFDPINMNGQTVVTVGTGIAVNSMIVVLAGNLDSNQGKIWAGPTGTFTAGKPSVKYCVINTNSNIGQPINLVVPENTNMMLTHLFTTNTAGAGQDIDVKFFIEPSTVGFTRLLAFECFFGNTPVNMPLDTVLAFEAGDYFTAVASPRNGNNLSLCAQIGYTLAFS